MNEATVTAQKLKFSIKDFFSKNDQIRSFLRICWHLLKKSLMVSLIYKSRARYENSMRDTHTREVQQFWLFA